MKIGMNGKHIDTTIIQWYAPSNDSEEEGKDAFYEQLQAGLENIPKHEMKAMMGDVNANDGNENTSSKRGMGKEGCGSMNNDGERLLEFCKCYGLVIGRTLFTHQYFHKLTWCSPNGKTRTR